ncbi:MAG TPA: hypothetical protein VIM69_01685 [Opitutaceae bacterium]
MPSADHVKILQSFRFSGATTGAFKSLRNFKKSHHTVPDAVNAATSAFLSKLAHEELAEEGESYFQKARAALQYKRKDVALDVSAGAAVLTAKDFVFEIHYALRETDPSEYEITRSLHSIRNADFLFTAECDALFPRLFREVIFTLAKGAPVEGVIDAIEGLKDSPLEVAYPSDYRSCTLSLPEVEAQVRFDGRELAMLFDAPAPPSQLWTQFLELRDAFALTKNSAITALVGG